MSNLSANAQAQANVTLLHFPGTSHITAHFSHSPSDTSLLLPSQTSLCKSKATPHVLEDLLSPCHPQLPTLQKPEIQGRSAFPGLIPSPGKPCLQGSGDGCGHPDSPTCWELPGAQLHSLPCLSPVPQCAVQPAASPDPAPNVLTTAVGLITKITF